MPTPMFDVDVVVDALTSSIVVIYDVDNELLVIGAVSEAVDSDIG